MDLVPGLQVILRHLKQAASLNGSRGILERFDLASNRWEVGFGHICHSNVKAAWVKIACLGDVWASSRLSFGR